jgi:hypothetical protein
MATDPGMATEPATSSDSDVTSGSDATADSALIADSVMTSGLAATTTDLATAPERASALVRPGFVTAAVALGGLALGGLAGYGLVHHSTQPHIILRQAGDSTTGFGFLNTLTDTAGNSSEVAIALRNDSSVSVQIIGATLAGQTAIIGPLAPMVDVPPKDTTTVYVGFPESNGCDEAVSNASFPIHPVDIVVFARTPRGATQQIPVEITGTSAILLDACEL